MNFNNVTFEASFGRAAQIKKSTLPEIVFSGRSNVGKSSLINKILNRKSLARVSSKPGKTGTINFYALKNAKFVDLPGYGYAKVSVAEKKRWAELVEGYFAQDRNLALVVQIVDFRHEPTKDDLDMINFLENREINFVVVCTKSDKLNKTERVKQTECMENLFKRNKRKFIIYSSVTGEGVEEIKNLIKASVQANSWIQIL